MNNPFTISFGMLPQKLISRPAQTNEIIDAFTSDQAPTHTFMITGVRGSGKTVMMTEICNVLRNRKDWTVLELNPEKDVLKSLASKLYNLDTLKHLFSNASISVSIKGFGFTIDNTPVDDYEVIVERMLKVLKKHHKHLLLAVDEAVNNPYIREFAHAFQIYLRQDYDIFLLMTGLYENLYELQNEKSLTFLYRAPKVFVEPLSFDMIAESYSAVFDQEPSVSVEMAKLTGGYAFAYQVLGYLKWERTPAEIKNLLPEFDHYLADYVYDKIWYGLTEKERLILHAIVSRAGSQYVRSMEIRDATGITKNAYGVYRDRLVHKGVVDGRLYGQLRLALPGFERFIQKKELYA